MSLSDASNLCITALSSNITPFVRVPFQCGDGYVQKILDGGAMGIIFPHVDSAEEAKRLSRVCKYPPLGSRSWTTGLPQLGYEVPKTPEVQVEKMNRWGSTVIVQIESPEAVENAEEIVAVDGVDMLLVGSNDLALEMGILGKWENPRLSEALRRVGEACKLHKKCFGIAGVYNQPALMNKIVTEFGARYVLAGVDIGLLGGAMRQNSAVIRSIQRA
jgi:2-keto-3-deoxy-L-rhamnonate aldolase RhmA